MRPLLEQVFDDAEVAEHRCTILWRHRLFVDAANCQISGGMHLDLRTPSTWLRGAKMNVFSLVPHDFPRVSGPH